MKINIKNLILIFLLVLSIILVFSLIDYLIHALNAEYDVPSRYFQNKVIYGTIVGFLTFLFIGRRKAITKALILSAVISILLQVRYFLEGYPKDFVFLFLAIHFLILFVISSITFKILEKKKIRL